MSIEDKFRFRVKGPTHISIPNTDDLKASKVYKTYEEYLKSDSWCFLKKKSNEIFVYTCLCCSSSENIHHHHLFYRQDWNTSQPHEVIPVCKRCHESIHINGKNVHSEPYDSKRFEKILNRTFAATQKGGGDHLDKVKKTYYQCLARLNLIVNYLKKPTGDKSREKHGGKRKKGPNTDLERHKREYKRRNWSC